MVLNGLIKHRAMEHTITKKVKNTMRVNGMLQKGRVGVECIMQMEIFTKANG